MLRLLVSAGGTAGGVYPALAVVDALSGHAEVLWVGGQGGMESGLVIRAGLRFEAIPAAGVHGVGLRALPGNLWQLARGYRAARSIVKDFQPEAMLFTGGYVGVPVALAGRGIPKVAYIPDLLPGLALRVITRLSDSIAVTTRAEAQSYAGKRVISTGYPTRPELQPRDQSVARQALGLDPQRTVVLVLGGSLGAHSINRAVWTALPGLLDVAQVLHLTGERDWPMVEGVLAELPERLAPGYHPHAFLHEQMGAALASADLVVARAGASALGEYPLFGLPAVLVPYPHAWRYQRANAEYLVDMGAAIQIEDDSLAQDLLPLVRRLLGDPARMQRMGEAMQKLAVPGAAAAIADEVRQVARRG
jgi:UDP-N-acetylglucosamine--N-acetylmuramyl-(pentapeptide) pyrophosphoryl-undecaprenol N-acetylglucosamine transferase